MFFGIAVLGIGTLRGEQSVDNYLQLRKSRDALQTRVNKLQSEINRYRTEITKIKSSKTYARRLLRDKYHDVDEDESIIFFEE